MDFNIRIQIRIKVSVTYRFLHTDPDAYVK